MNICNKRGKQSTALIHECFFCCLPITHCHKSHFVFHCTLCSVALPFIKILAQAFPVQCFFLNWIFSCWKILEGHPAVVFGVKMLTPLSSGVALARFHVGVPGPLSTCFSATCMLPHVSYVYTVLLQWCCELFSSGLTPVAPWPIHPCNWILSQQPERHRAPNLLLI